MICTFKLDLDNVKMNQHCFILFVHTDGEAHTLTHIHTHTHTHTHTRIHTHTTDRFIWSPKRSVAVLSIIDTISMVENSLEVSNSREFPRVPCECISPSYGNGNDLSGVGRNGNCYCLRDFPFIRPRLRLHTLFCYI